MLWALVSITTLVGACDGAPIVEPEPEPDVGPARLILITVSPVPDPLPSPGASVPLSAVGLYDDGSEGSLTGVDWSSTDESVGTVDDQGLFTAVGGGETEVVARLDGVEGRTTVRVDEEAEEDPRTLRVTSPGDTAFSLGIRMRFGATVLDGEGRPLTGSEEALPISWSSSDAGVAIVDDQGRVTPIADGSTTIIAETEGLRGERQLHVDGRVPVTIDLARAEALQWALEDSVSAWGFPGGLAAVSFPGGEIWLGAAGLSRPDRQMHPELEAYFASVTKTLIGAVVHQLADEGGLAYQDAIGNFLPPREHIDPGITVEQLLGHTSGLFDYVTDGGGVSLDALLADPDRLFTPSEILTSFLGPPRQAAGVSVGYSNTNTVALGEIIETVSGRSFYEEVRRRLLDPLALEHTYFPAWEDGSNERVTGYLSNGAEGTGIEVPSVESFAGASGGMVSTVSDMARWSRLLFDGDVVSSSAAARLRDAQRVDGGSLEPFNVEFVGIGQGAFTTRAGGNTFVGHGGTFPHTHAAIAHSDDLNLSVAVVVNRNGVVDLVEARLPATLLSVASEPVTGPAPP